jgi:hypothetical protein
MNASMPIDDRIERQLIGRHVQADRVRRINRGALVKPLIQADDAGLGGLINGGITGQHIAERHPANRRQRFLVGR